MQHQTKFLTSTLYTTRRRPLIGCRNGPWPDPNQTYFWPAINKRPTLLWPDPKRFSDPKGKNLGFWGEIFQTQTQTKDGWPNPTRPNLTRATKNWPDPSQIFFDPFTSLTTLAGRFYIKYWFKLSINKHACCNLKYLSHFVLFPDKV